jgi:hypothetical protein
MVNDKSAVKHIFFFPRGYMFQYYILQKLHDSTKRILHNGVLSRSTTLHNTSRIAPCVPSAVSCQVFRPVRKSMLNHSACTLQRSLIYPYEPIYSVISEYLKDGVIRIKHTSIITLLSFIHFPRIAQYRLILQDLRALVTEVALG